jgi:hypothetical protein
VTYSTPSRPTPMLLVIVAVSGCVAGLPPTNRWEAIQYDDFQNDRDRCRSVAERSYRYVDPRDGEAVAQRSIQVEARTQGVRAGAGME